MDVKPYTLQYQKNDIYLIPKEQQHTNTLIWFHGLGDNPNGYLDIFNSYYSPIPFFFKIILLCAPTAKLTLLNEETTSWFDIYQPGFRNAKSYNYEDVKKDKIKIQNIVEEEVKLLNGKYDKIFMGGFSQGACLSLDFAFTFEKKIGGVIACSGILFYETEIKKENKDINIFIAHGKYDNVINFDISMKSYDRIKDFKNVEIHDIMMKHNICEEEVEEIRKFIKKIC